MSYPTDVTVSFSCVPSSSVRRVRIASNGSIEEIHSDDIETGHIGCIVPVTTSNLSGKNISEIFSFSKLCVCACVCECECVCVSVFVTTHVSCADHYYHIYRLN